MIEKTLESWPPITNGSSRPASTVHSVTAPKPKSDAHELVAREQTRHSEKNFLT
jgi:hypothetical protein